MGLLDGLNEAQRRAVTHEGGPLLILAGAGTGKTRVVTARIAHLIDRGADPCRILAVTFTNKAAREMRDRVLALRGARSRGDGPAISTFHAFGLRFLREEHEALGLPRTFTLADESDQLAATRQALRAAGVAATAVSPGAARFRISLWKNAGLTPEEAFRLDLDTFEEDCARAFSEYEAALARRRQLDFDDLILVPARALARDSGLASRWRSRFAHILVDEFQDTNGSQFALLRALLEPRPDLCVVGDDDQSIYGWRGADIGHIRRFTTAFPGAAVVTLEQNYRSTNMILRAANQVIACNPGRREKNLWSALGDGEPVVTHVADDEREEAEYVAVRLSRQNAGGAPWRSLAVLFRARTQARPVEESLRARRIPYRLIGARSFFDRREVRDLLAYLRLVADPGDEEALLRVINTPPRGIGPKTVDRLNARSLEERISVAAAVAASDDERVRGFADLLGRLRAVTPREPAAVLERIVGETAYRAFVEMENRDAETASVRLRSIDQLLDSARALAARGCRDLGSFLDRLLLDDTPDEADDGTDRVTLLTIHAAKGLEFDHVILVGVEDGLLPHRRSVGSEEAEEDPARADASLEEERRLFYVAITRARRTLLLSRTAARQRSGRAVPSAPSPFLRDIDPSLLRSSSAPATGRSGAERLAEMRRWLERGASGAPPAAT